MREFSLGWEKLGLDLKEPEQKLTENVITKRSCYEGCKPHEKCELLKRLISIAENDKMCLASELYISKDKLQDEAQGSKVTMQFGPFSGNSPGL